AMLKLGRYKLDDGDVLPTVESLARALKAEVEFVSPATGQVLGPLGGAPNGSPAAQPKNFQDVVPSQTGTVRAQPGGHPQLFPPRPGPREEELPSPPLCALTVGPSDDTNHCQEETSAAREPFGTSPNGAKRSPMVPSPPPGARLYFQDIRGRPCERDKA